MLYVTSPVKGKENREFKPPCRSCPFNLWEEGRGNLNILSEKGTAKPLHYSVLKVTMNQNCELEAGIDRKIR